MSSLDDDLDEALTRGRLEALRDTTPNGPEAMTPAFIDEVVARRNEPAMRAFLYGLLDARETLG